MLNQTGNAELIWVPLLAGAACWLVVYLLLPKPMLLYVFGHELTHAIWTWIVKKIRASPPRPLPEKGFQTRSEP